MQPGEDVDDRDPGLHRLPRRRAGDAHQPADGLGQQVVARECGPLTGAEPGHGAVDDPRVDVVDLFVGQPVASHRAGAEVLDEDVGAADQFQRRLPVGCAVRSNARERLLRFTDRK